MAYLNIQMRIDFKIRRTCIWTILLPISSIHFVDKLTSWSLNSSCRKRDYGTCLYESRFPVTNKFGRFLLNINFSQEFGVFWTKWVLPNQEHLSKVHGRINQIRSVYLLFSSNLTWNMHSWHCWDWRPGLASSTAPSATYNHMFLILFLTFDSVWNNGTIAIQRRVT